MVDIWIKNTGTKPITQPTHPCDVLTAAQMIPDKYKSPVTKKIVKYIKEEIGAKRTCDVHQDHRECRVTFIDGQNFAREPEYGSWRSTFRLILGDCGYSMEAIKSQKKHGTELILLRDEFEKEDIGINMKEMNKKIHNYWVERWYDVYAFDFDEEERKELKNPFGEKIE